MKTKERGITISKKVEVTENGKKVTKWIEWNTEWSKEFQESKYKKRENEN